MDTWAVCGDEGGPVVMMGDSKEKGHFFIAAPCDWRYVVTDHPDATLGEAGERPVTLPIGTDLEVDDRTLPAAASRAQPTAEVEASSTARK